MFLQPKKFKYKKIKKGKLLNFEYKSNKIIFGEIGLKSIKSGIITSKQIEAARQAINRKIERKGKIWIRIFPNYPVTSKPSESRMGKGKGNINHWGAKVSKGSVLFEIYGVNTKTAISALKTGGAKLPIKTIVIKY